MATMEAGSAVPAEVARFDALAARWWDRQGPMRALHAMNPLRVGWVERRLPRPPTGAGGRAVRLLDVGCGAGIAAEAFARAGHDVLGLDASPAAVAAAEAHAALMPGLALRYRVGTPEALLGEEARFDAVTALEVIEHVADPASFLRTLAGLVVPGGRVFVSTLNRTWRSALVAKLGAEYVLRLLPVGTHDWRRFVTPAELGAHARAAGLHPEAMAGMVLDPLAGGWREGRDLSVNYLAALRLA